MTLRELRQIRRTTLEEQSVLCDVDPGTISRVERGLTKPRARTIVKLARGYGIAPIKMREVISETLLAAVSREGL